MKKYIYSEIYISIRENMMNIRLLSWSVSIVLLALMGCSNGTTAQPTIVVTTSPNATIVVTLMPSSVPMTTFTSSVTPPPTIYGRIAFTNINNKYPRIDNLALLNLDTEIIQNVSTMGWRSFSWSPDGTWIAFSGGFPATQMSPNIFLIKPDGSELKRLTDAPQGEAVSSWSPDGKFILYEIGNDLAVVSVDGRINYKLTYTSGYENYAVWSPDGKSIAYLYQKNATSPNELWLMDSKGHNAKQVIDFPVNSNSQIDWSSDGKSIIFVLSDNLENGSGNECGDIYIVKPDGSNLTRLTNLSGCATSVSWSLDGKKIGFIGRNRKGGNVMKLGWQVYVMDSDGQNIVAVTNEAEWVLYSLDWDPIH